MGTPRFLLGRLIATPGALNAFAATGENPIDYIVRHMNLDPGALGADDLLQNLRAVREGMRVFSAYELRDGTRIWIITSRRPAGSRFVVVTSGDREGVWFEQRTRVMGSRRLGR